MPPLYHTFQSRRHHAFCACFIFRCCHFTSRKLDDFACHCFCLITHKLISSFSLSLMLSKRRISVIIVWCHRLPSCLSVDFQEARRKERLRAIYMHIHVLPRCYSVCIYDIWCFSATPHSENALSNFLWWCIYLYFTRRHASFHFPPHDAISSFCAFKTSFIAALAYKMPPASFTRLAFAIIHADFVFLSRRRLVTHRGFLDIIALHWLFASTRFADENFWYYW